MKRNLTSALAVAQASEKDILFSSASLPQIALFAVFFAAATSIVAARIAMFAVIFAAATSIVAAVFMSRADLRAQAVETSKASLR